MPFPYKQQDLADALGLSLVHTNKTLAKLRDRQLASWKESRLQVNDVFKLADAGGISVEKSEPRPLI